MPDQIPNSNGTNDKPAFDLEERTAVFGEAVIRFARNIPKNPVTIPLISQIVRCRKEERETKLWLRMVAAAEPELKVEARTLWQEAKELHLIFAAIWRKT